MAGEWGENDSNSIHTTSAQPDFSLVDDDGWNSPVINKVQQSVTQSIGMSSGNKRNLSSSSSESPIKWRGVEKTNCISNQTSSSVGVDSSGWGNEQTDSHGWNDNTKNGKESNDNDSWGNESSSRNDSSRGFASRGSRNYNDDRRTDRRSDNYRSSNYGSNKQVIKIKSSYVGRVIGRGGATIKDLQIQSGARISINKDTQNQFDVEVELAGTTDQCKKAEQLINELTDNSVISSSSYQSSNYQSSNFQSSNNQSNNNWSSNYNSSSNSRSQPKQVIINDTEYEDIDWAAAIKESEEATRKKWAALPPVVKAFYYEDPEVASLTPKEVNQFRASNNNIMVSHFNENNHNPIPNPIITFEHAFSHYRKFDSFINQSMLFYHYTAF